MTTIARDVPAQFTTLLAGMPKGARDCVAARIKGVGQDGLDDFLRNFMLAMGMVAAAKPVEPSKAEMPQLPGFDAEFEESKSLSANDTYAMDRASVRTYDADNRLHVAETNISKANICPYIGREIPNWQKLNLDPDKEYKLFRDPDELKKAAATFNNIPLLSRHKPVNAEDHSPDLVIGSTGTDAEFVAPYLRNSLVIWARDAIEGVESGSQRELSSAYRYDADMTPGEYEGERYDGVMRNIIGNHVACVVEGRAGPDVVVGDSKRTGDDMAKPAPSRKAAVMEGALFAYLRPKLAQDAKVDFKPILANVTDTNFAKSKGVIVERVKKATAGKLAQDADIGDLVQLLNGLEGAGAEEVHAVEDAPDAPVDMPVEAIGEEPKPEGVDAGIEELKAFLVSKGMSEEDIAKVMELMVAKPAEEAPVDAPAEAPAAPEAEIPAEEPAANDEKDEDEKKDKDDMVTKPAMDAAIAAAVKSATEAANRVQREIRDAERAVRPYVGDLAMAHDSAQSVYSAALKSLGVKVDGVHPSAFPVILSMQPKAGEKTAKPARASVAMDSSSLNSFNEMFPDANRIRIM